MSLLALGAANVLMGQNTVVDASGRVQAMLYSGDQLEVRTNLVLPSPGWARTLGLTADRVRVTRSDFMTVWEGNIEMAPGQQLLFTQVIREVEGKTRLSLEYRAGADMVAEGLYFRVDVPRPEFKNGTAVLGEPPRQVTLPDAPPAGPNLLGGQTREIQVQDAASNVQFKAVMDQALYVNLQDKWNESPQAYTFWVYLHRGSMPMKTQGKVELELSVTGTPDTMPARLAMDASARRYRLHGFGGNYCFNLASPVTQYTLDNLRSAWARTEMKLEKWEPNNDNGTPYEADWSYFEKQDQPGTDLRRGFLIGQQLHQRGIPQVISIWWLPEWMYTDPGQKTRSDHGRLIDPLLFEEFLESVGAYLLYGRDKYGFEPELFSFNEPNLGVYVLFTPEAHRELVKRVGAHFEKLGLKTKLLIGDVNHPRGTHTYVQPALQDPEAMKYAGALSFHSWGGATEAQYAAWADTAERAGLPLLVAEAGTDAAAWRGQSFDSYWYGMGEVRQYQELLLHARPQALMYWEFTSDYGLAREKATGVEPTARFWFMKQFTDLTPRHSDAVGSVSDHPKVLFTAFEAGGQYALHVANLAAARTVTIEGLPERITSISAVRTSETESFAELETQPPGAGALRLDLPARCLLTLVLDVAPPPTE